MSTGYAFPTGVEDGFQVELENGVTYEFRAEFQRWDVVKGTGNSVWITDELPDDNYVSNGDLWFDNTEDTMQLFLWHEESGAWLPVAPPTTLEGRVEAGEATQQAIIAQIQESLVEQANISKRVDELSITKGSVARYVVKGTSINVATRNGELYVNSPNAADVEYISFAPFDSNGQATKPCNKDDIVEFVEAVGGKYAGDITRYRVVSGDSNALTVEYLSGENDFEVGEAEEVYVYPQNSDLASVDYVDAQDEALKEQIDLKMSLTGTQRLSPDNFWRLKQVTPEGNDQTYLSISNAEIRLYHVAEPAADDHATTKKYVDDRINAIPDTDLSGYATEQFVADAIDAIPETDLSGYATEQYVTDAIDAIPETDLSEYFKKSGGTITGSLNINKGNKPNPQFRITPNGGDNYATNIYAMSNGEMRFRSSHTDSEEHHVGSHIVMQANDGAPTTKIYHVPEPNQPHMAVSKEYVDTQISAIPSPSEAVAGPASLCWEWRNHDTLSDPGEGKAAWYSASNFFRLNLKTASGAFLGKNVLARKDVTFDTKPTGGIWRLVDGDWQMIQLFDIYRMQWNHNDCIWLYRNNLILGGNNFTAGEKYYFTVGGFF